MELGLRGAVAVVTGGSRGVGAGISHVLQTAGASVVSCGRTTPDHLSDGVEFLPCDVREREQVEALVALVVERYGRLDVLVNNAGGAPYSLAQDASPRLSSRILELNLLAPLLAAQAANTVMQQQETGGSIVMVSSVSGHRPSPGTAAYGAAKAGLDSLSASLAVEWAPRVRVNSVVCGMVRTESAHLHYGDESGLAAVARTIPLGRLAVPVEIGNCVAFLASPLASYVTGSTLTAHGGGERPAFLDAAAAEAAAGGASA